MLLVSCKNLITFRETHSVEFYTIAFVYFRRVVCCKDGGLRHCGQPEPDKSLRLARLPSPKATHHATAFAKSRLGDELSGKPRAYRTPDQQSRKQVSWVLRHGGGDVVEGAGGRRTSRGGLIELGAGLPVQGLRGLVAVARSAQQVINHINLQNIGKTLETVR